MNRLFLSVLLLLLPAVAQAQHETMPIKVAATQIEIGPEFVPRCTGLPNVLRIPVGATFELEADSSWDCIEVEGVLKVSRTHDTTLRVTHLLIFPGGTLDAGWMSDPITKHVEIIIRDVPIDLTRDPFRWGNGLVNFGHQFRIGVAKTAWVEAAGSLAKGSTTIALASTPTGWQVGDELLLPDTVTVPDQNTLPRKEQRITIAAISGVNLTVSKPFDFAHPDITDPNGTVVLRPRVANLTRNIVVRSENPLGTHGHTADIGHLASYDVRYNAVIDMGRTKFDVLDDTVLPHIGTNQRGKYALHAHHLGSCPSCVLEGNVAVSTVEFAKWGFTFHQTSDTRIERNLCVGFPGACFATEDGYEVRNRFLYNFAAYSLGHTNDAQGNVFDALKNVIRNAPGSEGTGFWLRGTMNYFEGNEGWNNYTSGINLFNQNQPVSLYPSQPGGEPDTALSHFTDHPLSFLNNVTAVNISNGVELWGVKGFEHVHTISAYNTYRQIFAINSDGIDVRLTQPIITCANALGHGVDASMGYVEVFTWQGGGSITGCEIGIHGGGGANGMTLSGALLQNKINIDMVGQHYRQGPDVRHVALGQWPHAFIVMGDGFVWDGQGHIVDPKGVMVNIPGMLPKVGVSKFTNTRGSDVIAENWQGTGQTYRFFERQSLAENPAWFASSYDGTHTFDCPVDPALRWTMGQCYATFGLAHGGEAPRTADTVTLDGVISMTEGGEINGSAPALSGVVIPYGPPRAVITYPHRREAPLVEGGANDRRVRISAILTGNPLLASRVMWIQEDDDAPVPYVKDGDDRSYSSGHSGPGIHRITVWRDLNGVKIPGSETFTEYCVSACDGATPPPPPTPTTTTVPNVVGMTQATATSALLAAHLRLGTVSSAPDAAPIGQVFRQIPDAGLVASVDSVVNLNLSAGPPTLTWQSWGRGTWDLSFEREINVTTGTATGRERVCIGGQCLAIPPR